MKLEEVGLIFCTCDYALNNYVLHPYLNSPTVVRASQLVPDYASMQKAEGRYKGNNHPVSSDIDTLPSHFTDQCNHTTKGNKFSLHGTELACMYVYSYATTSLKGRRG